jgi:EAL domain-containing protein (putative c-di-GMP-specific phosphodiesterase class I)
MHEAVVTRLEAIASLRRAHEHREFRLLFQPIYELATGRIVEVEGLVRRLGLDGTLVSPAEFIPLAEETGLIVPIGDWVIEAGCRALKSWEGGEGAPSLSLNVSARQLQDPGFGSRLQTTLRTVGIEPGRLTLEITESRLMSSPEVSLRLLRELKGLGVRLAIDDFGTGYSSLSYLRSLPVDTLKIDQSFAHGLDRDVRSVGLVKGILELARALGLGVVAEGIEEPEQARTLLGLGCPHAQGFLFARPLSEDTLGFMLRDEAREARRIREAMELDAEPVP